MSEKVLIVYFESGVAPVSADGAHAGAVKMDINVGNWDEGKYVQRSSGR